MLLSLRSLWDLVYVPPQDGMPNIIVGTVAGAQLSVTAAASGLSVTFADSHLQAVRTDE